MARMNEVASPIGGAMSEVQGGRRPVSRASRSPADGTAGGHAMEMFKQGEQLVGHGVNALLERIRGLIEFFGFSEEEAVNQAKVEDATGDIPPPDAPPKPVPGEIPPGGGAMPGGGVERGDNLLDEGSGMPRLVPGPSIDTLPDISPTESEMTVRERLAAQNRPSGRSALEQETNRLAEAGYKMLIERGFTHDQAIQRLFGGKQSPGIRQQYPQAYQKLIQRGYTPEQADEILKTAVEVGRGAR